MFLSSTILRELIESLAKVIFQLKHSVKLRHIYYVEMWQHVVKWCVCCLLCRLMQVGAIFMCILM